MKNIRFLLIFAPVVAFAETSAPAQAPAQTTKQNSDPADVDVGAMQFPDPAPGAKAAIPAAALPPADGSGPPTPATPSEPAAATSAPTAQAIELKGSTSLLAGEDADHAYDFKGEDLDKVAALIEAEFHVKMVIDADGKLPITGRYSSNEVDGVLGPLCADAKLRYERRNDVIYVSRDVSPALTTVSLASLRADGISATGNLAANPQVSTGSSVGNGSKIMHPADSSSVNASTGATANDPAKESHHGFHFFKSTKDTEDAADLAQLSKRRAKLLNERNNLLANSP